jgi:hypothetical protein
MSDSSIVGVVLARSPPIHQVQSGKASFGVYQSDMKGTEVTAVTVPHTINAPHY